MGWWVGAGHQEEKQFAEEGRPTRKKKKICRRRASGFRAHQGKGKKQKNKTICRRRASGFRAHQGGKKQYADNMPTKGVRV